MTWWPRSVGARKGGTEALRSRKNLRLHRHRFLGRRLSVRLFLAIFLSLVSLSFTVLRGV
jgi:hypothetical protein